MSTAVIAEPIAQLQRHLDQFRSLAVAILGVRNLFSFALDVGAGQVIKQHVQLRLATATSPFSGRTTMADPPKLLAS